MEVMHHLTANEPEVPTSPVELVLGFPWCTCSHCEFLAMPTQICCDCSAHTAGLKKFVEVQMHCSVVFTRGSKCSMSSTWHACSLSSCDLLQHMAYYDQSSASDTHKANIPCAWRHITTTATDHAWPASELRTTGTWRAECGQQATCPST